MSCGLRLAFCALSVVNGARVITKERTAVDDGGKSFLSVMTWNVEKLDGDSTEKTEYVNGVVTDVVKKHKVDLIMLQEARSCSLMQGAMDATGMDCVDSPVSASQEAKVSFIVLGSVILYSKALFDPSAGWSRNRARDSGEWRRWLDNDDQSVTDKNGKSLKTKWQETCTWRMYRNGQGCNNIVSDIPTANSFKLYLKTGVWSTALLQAFPHGIRAVNIHLFSGVSHRELTDQIRMDKRTFQMRAMVWLNKVWNFNDKYNSGDEAPVTIYAGDFNTRAINDLSKVLAPAKDYNMQPWAASDSLRTHAGGQYLDHVVLSSKPSGAIVRSSTEMYEQFGCRGCVNSDHNPLVVKLYANTKAAPKPTGPKVEWAGWGPATSEQGGNKPNNASQWPSLGEGPQKSKEPSLDEGAWPTLG